MPTITKPATHSKLTWLPTVVVSLAFLLLCGLGTWQLQRGASKEALIAQQNQASQQIALDNQALIQQTNLTAIRYYPVKLRGVFDNSHAFLLDNKTKNGRVGYELYLPLELDKNTVILIARGFIAQGTSRAQLPAISPQKGEFLIEGYVDFAYRNPFIKQAIESTQYQWPLRVQQLDPELFTQLLGKKVIPVLVESKLKELPVSPTRHWGYAAQWFGLAIALVIVYYFVRRQKELP